MSDWVEQTIPQRSKRSNTILSGYLRRSGRTGKTLGLRQKRFYKLDGAIFSKHLTENSSAIWDINVQGATVGRLGKTNFGIRLNSLEKRAAKDFNMNLIVLYARTEEECSVWVSALRDASQRKLEDFYEVKEIIGEGGFAKVRLGRCLNTNEKRAIKTMNKAEAHAKVLGTEVAIIKKVDHPNIVKTFDVFETSEQIHIVMEYMEGGMLYDSIEDGVHFDEADIIQFMRELLDGVLYLHEIGIVHRDIKPENVLCTSKKTPLHVKIADFGLSSISTVADMKENRMLMSTMIGTPEFVAPEIARQETYTEKVDMWALGMLCYNVIARRLPLDDNQDMINQIKKGIHLTFPEPEWTQYSDQARSFVRSLLCNESEKRLSPLGCLVHRWIETIAPERSTKFAAHGRMSNILFAPDAKQRQIMDKHRHLNVKSKWKKIYLVINALCKLSSCNSGLKLFGTVKLGAVSLAFERKDTALEGVEFSETNENSKRHLPFQRGLESAVATSYHSTDEYHHHHHHHHHNKQHRKSGAGGAAAKLARELSKFGGGEKHSKSVRKMLESNHNRTSPDLDLAFDEMEIGDDDLDIPKSFNSNDPVATAIFDQPSSRGILKFPAFGKKGKAFGHGNGSGSVHDHINGNDKIKINKTEVKGVRKLVGKTKGVVRGIRVSGEDGYYENNHKGTYNNNNQQDPINDDPTASSFATTSGVLSKPWRSSFHNSKNKTEHESHDHGRGHSQIEKSTPASFSASVKPDSVTSGKKTTFRKRFHLPFGGLASGSGSHDSRHNMSFNATTEGGVHSSRKQAHGNHHMRKITRMLRGKGDHKADGIQIGGGDNYHRNGMTDSKSLTGGALAMMNDQDDDAVASRNKMLSEEDKRHMLLEEGGVKSFDVAHLQEVCGDDQNINHKGTLMNKILKGKHGGSSTKRKGKDSYEEEIMNRMSPLTPSMDSKNKSKT